MNAGTKRFAILIAFSLALGTPAAWADQKSDEYFKMMDTNADGKISRAEHAAGAKKMFTETDANRDGTVTAAEMDAAYARRGETPAKDDLSSAEKIKEIDQNNDGKLTTAEHETGTETMFGKMDTDHDGVISKTECEMGMKMMKKPAATEASKPAKPGGY